MVYTAQHGRRTVILKLRKVGLLDDNLTLLKFSYLPLHVRETRIKYADTILFSASNNPLVSTDIVKLTVVQNLKDSWSSCSTTMFNYENYEK